MVNTGKQTRPNALSDTPPSDVGGRNSLRVLMRTHDSHQHPPSAHSGRTFSRLRSLSGCRNCLIVPGGFLRAELSRSRVAQTIIERKIKVRGEANPICGAVFTVSGFNGAAIAINSHAVALNPSSS